MVFDAISLKPLLADGRITAPCAAASIRNGRMFVKSGRCAGPALYPEESGLGACGRLRPGNTGETLSPRADGLRCGSAIRGLGIASRARVFSR